ncbi:MAG: hypothetical protein HOV77_06605 [Hamadaea sp.]|uniref:hypothetical protein n=1 Tax=Hamadaea sp. TaxID=2024425 RepID=UPI00185EE393|nr:hypothetical protein [Hamadaea sp.]NUT18837.1 hypothetical protein [Hamadaea sp.]
MDADLVSAIGSLASVAVAVIAAIVAYFSWRAAQNAADATAVLTEIEKARWHAENRPEFQLECEGLVMDNRLAACSITLTDSRSLAWVDVIASVRPRVFGRTDTEADFGPYVWDDDSPYYDGPIDTETFRLHPGGDETLYMRAASTEEWERYTNPIRLWLHCTAENGDTWMVPAATRLVPLQLAESIVTREQIEAQAESRFGGDL